MANIRLTANETRFVAAMNNSAGAVGRLSAELNVRLARAMREADTITRNFQAGIGRLGEKIESVGRKMTALFTVPLGLAGGMATKVYGDIDQLKRALDVYGVSLDEIKETAKLPGLGLEEAAQATIKFLSVKYAVDQSNKAVREFGNALVYSGRGKENLDGIALAFAQMKGKGKVMAEEVNQIAERLPMVRDLMKQAFGTSDTEVLQKKGIRPDQFLDAMLKQLEKLPRVAGGFKVAWENIGDALKIASYEFIGAADRAFGLTEKLKAISDWIGSMVDKFKMLTPESQKFILVITTIVAAIGPLVTVIGFFISTIVPAFVTGIGAVGAALGAINLPIVFLVGAIAFMARQIITHWDALKAKLDNSGLLDNAIIVINYGLALIGDLFTVFKGFITGDWEELWTGLVNILKRIWNGVVEIIATPFKAFFELEKILAKTFNLNFVVGDADAAINQINKITDAIKFNVPASTLTLKSLGEQLKKTFNTPTTDPDKGDGGKGKPKDLPIFARMNAMAAQLQYGLAVATNNIQLAMAKIDNIPTAKMSFLGDLDLKIKEKGTKVLATSREFATQLNNAFTNFGINIYTAGDNLQKKVDALWKKIKFVPNIQNLDLDTDLINFRNEFFQKFKKVLSGDDLKNAFDLSKFLTASVENGIESIAEGLGEAIGSGGGLQKVFSNIMNMLGDFMIQLGKKLFTINAIVIEALGKIGGPAGIAISLGLIVLGATIKSSQLSKARPFANGAIAYGPTLGLVGEYPGAGSNPEVIAPLSKLKDMLGGSIGGDLRVGDVRLEGEAMVITINRHLKSKGLPGIG